MATNMSDIVIYAWIPKLGREIEARFSIEGLDENGKGRAAIGKWITEALDGTAEDHYYEVVQLENGPRVPALSDTSEVLDATTDTSPD